MEYLNLRCFNLIMLGNGPCIKLRIWPEENVKIKKKLKKVLPVTHLGEGWPPCHWLSVCQPLCDKRSQLTLTSVTSDIQGICDVWDFCEIYVSETILPSGGKRSWCSRPEWNAQSQPRGRACKNLKIGSRLKRTVRKSKSNFGCERCVWWGAPTALSPSWRRRRAVRGLGPEHCILLYMVFHICVSKTQEHCVLLNVGNEAAGKAFALN